LYFWLAVTSLHPTIYVASQDSNNMGQGRNMSTESILIRVYKAHRAAEKMRVVIGKM
jgi:hypothetical protein